MIKGLEDKIVKAYYEYMVDMAVIYGSERSRAERELKESLDFEIALANVMWLYNFSVPFMFMSLFHRFHFRMKNEGTPQPSIIQ